MSDPSVHIALTYEMCIVEVALAYGEQWEEFPQSQDFWFEFALSQVWLQFLSPPLPLHLLFVCSTQCLHSRCEELLEQLKSKPMIGRFKDLWSQFKHDEHKL